MISTQPIAQVQASGPGASSRVAGRVIDCRPGPSPSEHELCLQDASGSLRLLSPTPAALGAWVQASGRWDGTCLRCSALEVAQPPGHSFPRPDGEWAWAHQQRPGQLQRLAQRHQLLRAVRRFFDAQGFCEVETPLVVPSPGLDPHLDAFEVVGTPAPRWLITSPEYQMKRMLAAGLPRIYQICKCFRREEQGPLHQPEFTMLEWYRTFDGIEGVMQDTENLVAHLACELHGSPEIDWSGERIDLTPPWPRISVAEAFETYAQVMLQDLPDEDSFFRLLVERVEPALGRGRPSFLTDYPASMASLARRSPQNPAVAERFEAYVAGVELCNGFGELVDAAEQRQRLIRDQALRRAQGLPVYPIDERFLAALDEGVPPSGGNALGVDRLAMLLLGAPEIQDVVAVDAGRL